MVENYRDLLNAVVEQAAWDYTRALCMAHNARTDGVRDRTAIEIAELEHFFTGDGIQSFTKLDGTALMERLQREAKEYDYDLKKIKKSRSVST